MSIRKCIVLCVCVRREEEVRQRNSELAYIEINQKDLLVYWVYQSTYLVSS